MKPTLSNIEDLVVESSKREDPKSSDEYHLYRASIVEIMGEKNDLLRVRPLPYFADLDDSETGNLPKYPPWIKGKVITGVSEKSSGQTGKNAIGAAEQVWIVATPDFGIGYVIDKANAYGEPNTSKKYPWSYDYKNLKDYITQRRCLPKNFDYANLDVIRWYATGIGGCLECFNHRTGDWILLNSSGTVLTVQQEKIYLRVGTPPSPVSSGPVAFSAITMTPDKIHLKSPNIEIDAKDLTLGHHGLELMGAHASVITGTNGTSGQKVPNIHV